MNSWVWHENYHGTLHIDRTSEYDLTLSGLHFNGHASTQHLINSWQEEGTYFGMVMTGRVLLRNPDMEPLRLRAGQWFSIPNTLRLDPIDSDVETRVLLIFQRVYQGFYAMGGPMESTGRLRYIDGCSDSLLLCPPRLGDPCLNLLHFPPGVKQTMHYHPSARMGAVISGSGLYVTENARQELRPGSIFFIPKGIMHHFETQDATLNVFAFHPDSDWGPQDEVHPMINRTWVEGAKISAGGGYDSLLH